MKQPKVKIGLESIQSIMIQFCGRPLLPNEIHLGMKLHMTSTRNASRLHEGDCCGDWYPVLGKHAIVASR